MVNFKNKRITIIGMGKSGLAAAKILHSQGAKVKICDVKEDKELKDILEDLKLANISYFTGGYEHKSLLNSDLIVISPGVPFNLPELVEARYKGCEVISEIELAYQLNPTIPIIAITGTNGKTTTTTLLGEIFKSARIPARVVGNIGIPLCQEVVSATPEEVMITEVSSFQLEGIKDFKPKISVVLNIGEDHLDRHQDMESYYLAKCRIFENQTQNDALILNYDDIRVRKMRERAKCQVFFFSQETKQNVGMWCEDGKIWASFPTKGKTLQVCSLEEVRIKGRHNIENVMSAVSVSLLMGLEVDRVREVLKEFPGLEHRQEEVRMWRGVRFVNDSKGTNPHATICAINALSSSLSACLSDGCRQMISAAPAGIILIAGGKDKDLNFEELAKLIKEKVKLLILIGETKYKIKSAVEKKGFHNLKLADTLEEAVNLSSKYAVEGDVVLFSPACSSFDMFKDYEERGKLFKSAVYKLT